MGQATKPNGTLYVADGPHSLISDWDCIVDGVLRWGGQRGSLFSANLIFENHDLPRRICMRWPQRLGNEEAVMHFELQLFNSDECLRFCSASPRTNLPSRSSMRPPVCFFSHLHKMPYSCLRASEANSRDPPKNVLADRGSPLSLSHALLEVLHVLSSSGLSLLIPRGRNLTARCFSRIVGKPELLNGVSVHAVDCSQTHR